MQATYIIVTKKPRRRAVKLPSVCCNNNQHCRPPCASKLFEGAK